MSSRRCLAVLQIALAGSLSLAPPLAMARSQTEAARTSRLLYEEIDPEKLDKLSLEQLLNVVVSSTLVAQDVKDAPSSVVVVSAQEIREKGYRTIKEIMNDVPGFNDVSDTNEEISAVHGMFASTTNKVLILVNGHRMNDFFLGRYNVDQFLGLDIVDRVELIRGPASAIYGTGALVGLVNIITKKGAALDGTSARARVGMYTREGSLSYGKAHGDLDILFNLTFLDAPGQDLDQGAELDVAPSGGAKSAGQVYLGKYPTNVSAILSVRSKDTDITLRGAHFARATPRTGTGSLYDFDAELFKPLYTENDVFVDFTHRFTLGKPDRTLTVNPSVHYINYFEYSWLAWGIKDSPPIGHRGGQDTEMINYALKVLFQDRFLDSLRVVAGFDTTLAHFFHADAFDIATGDTKGQMTPEGTAETGLWFMFGGIAQAIWEPLTWLKVTAGGRFDYFHEEADPQFTPRAGIIFRPLDDLSIKLIYGMSYLAPGWLHKRSGLSTFQGNPDLGPEIFHGAHLIGMYTFRRKLTTSIDIFYAELSGLINQVPTADGSGNTYNNFGRVAYTGFDMTADYLALDSHFLKLRLNAAYSFVYPVEDRIDEPVLNSATNTKLTFLTDGAITNIPTHTVRYGLRLEPLDKLIFSVWGRLYSEVETIDPILGDSQNGNRRTLPVVALLDAAINYSILGFDLQLLFRNATNASYEIGGSVPRPLPRQGFSVEGMVGYTF